MDICLSSETGFILLNILRGKIYGRGWAIAKQEPLVG